MGGWQGAPGWICPPNLSPVGGGLEALRRLKCWRWWKCHKSQTQGSSELKFWV